MDNLNDLKFLENVYSNYLKAKMFEENLGIPDPGVIYHHVNENQDMVEEFKKTEKFLNWIVKNYPQIFDKISDIEFINYGDTELVYVIDQAGYKQTLLVGQPNIEKNIVRKEYKNLIKLAKQNPNLVICPTNYFENEDRQAYLTPYIYQARCIVSSDTGYGAYVPEPRYHFLGYDEQNTYTICKAIIANLVLLYNQDEQLGLASCKIGGGDFILEKEYDEEIHSIENTLKRMHLIAARELVNIDFDSYIKLLKNEFTKRTYYKNISERDKSIIVNHKNRIPMSEYAIEDGIQLGLKLRR